MSGIETICALATPSGNASVGIVRISGPAALSIAKVLTQKSLKPRYAHFSSFFDQNKEAIDNGIAIYFPAPSSFTGEDVVELQSHGNPYVCQKIIRCVIQQGARLALAGEFSERAFVNSKLDLTQLEAIADLIASGSERAAKSAVLSMQGKFSEQIQLILQQLIQVRTHIEAALDFDEESVETEARAAVGKKLTKLSLRASKLLGLAGQGAQLQKSFTIVLTGSPNVGKSSLFNALCEQDRAIVTNSPGTTRDVVSVDMHLKGLPVRLLDTAGIRKNAELAEREGITRARSALEVADVVIRVLDGTKLQTKGQLEGKLKNEIIAINKSDLLGDGFSPPGKTILVSAKTGYGLSALRNVVEEALHVQPAEQQAPFSARERHLDALVRCLKHLKSASQQISSTAPLELAAEELRIAQQAVGEITGEFTPDDLLDYVFREFCIGK